jgi:hypothetical protein
VNRKQKDVEGALVSKGFALREGDHHRFIYFTQAGKKTRVHTKTSHPGRLLGDDLLHAMAKQCRLSNKDFLALIDCPLDRQGYEALLANAGGIS